LGHRKLSVTVDVYQHSDLTAQREAVDLLNSIISAPKTSRKTLE